MFKNWFRSTNEKRMEEQIVKLREDIVVLQTKISVLEKQLITVEVVKEEHVEENPSNILEPREEPIIEEKPIVEVPVVIKEEKAIVVDVVKPSIEKPEKEEKVEETIVVDVVKPSIEKQEKVETIVVDIVKPDVEKETNPAPPKKRRQSKKASQLEEALPK